MSYERFVVAISVSRIVAWAGVSNLSRPVLADDASYIADSFIGLLKRRVAAGNKPFLAQVREREYFANHIGWQYHFAPKYVRVDAVSANFAVCGCWQLAYHNNHIPYVATSKARADCAAGKTCKAISPSAGNAAVDYTSMQASKALRSCGSCFLSAS